MVLGRSREPEIADTVVEAIAVGVVKVANRPLAEDVKPSEAMRAVKAPIKAQKDIAKPLAGMPSLLPGTPNIGGGMHALAVSPVKLPGDGVIIQHLSQLLGR
jgi:hypothetical protein